MSKDIKHFVGLDVHKDTIVIGVADPGRAKARVLGTVAHDMKRLARALNKLADPGQVHVVYEAGPTGYGLHRWLSRRGHPNEVIAPSMTPRRAGERIKTDRRDSTRLAQLSRAGELTAVHVPEPADEAMRDLSRTREDALRARLKARQQLGAILLRHDKHYPGKTNWTKTYYAWLGKVKFEHRAQQIAFTEAHLAVQGADDRVQRLTQAMIDLVPGWRYEPVVKALQALRGIEWVSAVGLIVTAAVILTRLDGVKVTHLSNDGGHLAAEYVDSGADSGDQGFVPPGSQYSGDFASTRMFAQYGATPFAR